MVIAGLELLAASTRLPLALALNLAGFGLSFWAGMVIYPGAQPEYVLLSITTLGPTLLLALTANASPLHPKSTSKLMRPRTRVEIQATPA